MPKKLSREQLLRKERRLVRVPVDIELIAKQIQDPSITYKLRLVDGIPPNSVFITAYYSMESFECYFVYAHELFDEVEEGTIVPIKRVTINKIIFDEDY